MIENTYGLDKRLHFIAEIISDITPSRVLDIGCGTGENVTSLLADQFPDIEFVGIDSDAESIDYAINNKQKSNLKYLNSNRSQDIGKFELVIASEVIEHVESPHDFLTAIYGYLAPGGKVILTLPNGFGPFEVVSFIETLMHLSGIYQLLRRAKQLIKPRHNQPPVDTLAVSPHINFFSYKKIRTLIINSGFQILYYKPRTFLCGFIFDQCIRSKTWILWNSEVADSLPPQLVSAWMFLLTSSDQTCNPMIYTRSNLGLFRRYLNEKRWGL